MVCISPCITKTGDTAYDIDDLGDTIFRSFVRFFRSIVRFSFVRKFSKNRSRCCDDFGIQKSSKSELSSWGKRPSKVSSKSDGTEI